MISVDEALNRILDSISPLDTVNIPLDSALNCTLAEDCYSGINMPPFDQSAMDGYAINEGDFSSYKVVGEIQAGDNATDITLAPGEAVRIFTGAMVPKSATTVVKQEIIEHEGTTLSFTESFNTGTNIRYTGEQIKKGEIALKKGAILNPAAIGFIAMLGIQDVCVYRKPIVRILITGNELIEAGNKLEPGQIYESNFITLSQALKQLNIDAEVVRIRDTYEETYNTIGSLINSCDILITSGGISVGDYDFVGNALRENGVHESFYKIKQKPGKPLFYGYSDTCKVFALPGNPASALTSMYLYAFPAIHKMMGSQTPGLTKRTLPLSSEYSKTPKMTHFLKGKINGESVEIMNHQSSAMLNSFGKSDCIIRLNEGQQEWNAGDAVTVYLLP